MEGVKLDAKKRTETGKGPCRRLRSSGLIPSIMYGHKDIINLVLNQHEFGKLTHHITKSTIINLNVEGKVYDVLIKDYEKDYIKDKFIHIDFFELQKDKAAIFFIPVICKGTPLGVKDGGTLVKHLTEIKVECLPGDIVANFEFDVNELNIGDSIHIGDIKFDSKFKILTNSEEVIVFVAGKEKEEEIPVEAAAVEGEVAVEGEAAAASATAAPGTAPAADKEQKKDQK